MRSLLLLCVVCCACSAVPLRGDVAARSMDISLLGLSKKGKGSSPAQMVLPFDRFKIGKDTDRTDGKLTDLDDDKNRARAAVDALGTKVISLETQFEHERDTQYRNSLGRLRKLGKPKYTNRDVSPNYPSIYPAKAIIKYGDAYRD